MKKTKNKYLQFIISFIMLTVGTVIAAYALESFLIPNTILDGGVTGISIIVSKLTNIPLSILVLLINIPFVYVGFRNLGKGFLVRTIYTMGLFSLCLNLFHNVEPLTEQILLATVFGGVLLGVGVGLIIHFGGCVDGTAGGNPLSASGTYCKRKKRRTCQNICTGEKKWVCASPC